MNLSVIVPTLNEETLLPRALASVPRGAEVVVADGRSADRTREVAVQLGARVVVGAPGRGAQMNQGAREASGDTLLFLHADCALGPGADEAIRQALSDACVVGGWFRLSVRPARPSLALVSFGSNLRARLLGLPYGDQALFMRRSVFDAIGGYRDVPIMEDVDLVRRLRKRGRLKCLDATVTTLPRHWERSGPLFTTLVNWAAIAAFSLGVSPSRLAPIYHRLHRNPRDDRASP
ncbi:MAG TPA: TIGR04283 family arsenosugar biosynthesis glycosyltransferase [Vicinamibacteria bacterium]|nr:TIGR04283 family arsenosugar biosynthesis glycosyltransferase [Vicinamibacteria bacterium]